MVRAASTLIRALALAAPCAAQSQRGSATLIVLPS